MILGPKSLGGIDHSGGTASSSCIKYCVYIKSRSWVNSSKVAGKGKDSVQGRVRSFHCFIVVDISAAHDFKIFSQIKRVYRWTILVLMRRLSELATAQLRFHDILLYVIKKKSSVIPIEIRIKQNVHRPHDHCKYQSTQMQVNKYDV